MCDGHSYVAIKATLNAHTLEERDFNLILLVLKPEYLGQTTPVDTTADALAPCIASKSIGKTVTVYDG